MIEQLTNPLAIGGVYLTGFVIAANVAYLIADNDLMSDGMSREAKIVSSAVFWPLIVAFFAVIEVVVFVCNTVVAPARCLIAFMESRGWKRITPQQDSRGEP